MGFSNLWLGLQGKTIAWTGFDEETSRWVVLFTDKTGVMVEDESTIEVADVDTFIQATLDKTGQNARQIMKLETLYKEPAAAPDLVPVEEAEAKTEEEIVASVDAIDEGLTEVEEGVNDGSVPSPLGT
jgi:hypothetical protein